MHELYRLRDNLCDELKSYGDKGVNVSNLDVIDKLAHATKNLDKVIDRCEEDGEYSSASYPDGMGGSYRRSYARGRMNPPRDRMGRYSGNDDDKEAIRREIHALEDRLNKM